MRAEVILMMHNTKPVAVAAACTVITTDASSTHAATLYFFCISNHINTVTVNKMNLHSALLRSVSKAFRYGPCVTRGSHSSTCRPDTNHTGLYSPAARCHCPLISTHCTFPRRDGQAVINSGRAHTTQHRTHCGYNPG